ncbi:hypothetical protein M404DRAFT_33132 [Pisolithus tinctorius Marx 270]|uniref:Uncharacterized protein n=1 Tax=Pisolithus tinctorius Marx 270 TaxID=870435 RepID=A0A0C3IHL8_PISTI|nr:hypothetical protein M404DRAFT_33132 [Pisolithus tinctorius Marx 270]
MFNSHTPVRQLLVTTGMKHLSSPAVHIRVAVPAATSLTIDWQNRSRSLLAHATLPWDPEPKYDLAATLTIIQLRLTLLLSAEIVRRRFLPNQSKKLVPLHLVFGLLFHEVATPRQDRLLPIWHKSMRCIELPAIISGVSTPMPDIMILLTASSVSIKRDPTSRVPTHDKLDPGASFDHCWYLWLTIGAVLRAIMATSIPFENDTLLLLIREPLPYPMPVELLVIMRNGPFSGFMDMISVSLHLLVNLLLRGVAFFFCPMVMDVVNAGHLVCYEVRNVTIGVLYVVGVVNRTTRISNLRCTPIPSIAVLAFLSDFR